MSNELRECKLGVVVGRKRVGKTFTTNKLIEQYVMGNPAKGVAGRKVLILDANDEFTHIAPISIADLAYFTIQQRIEARRIRPIHQNGKSFSLDDLVSTLNIILEVFKGGLLLIEDINKYVTDNMKRDLMGAIATNAHKDLDIILHYQGIGRIGTKVWQNITWLRFHKITDNTKRHIKKFEEIFELLRIVELMVDKEYDNGNIRFYQYVNCEDMKLMGNINKDIFKEACMTYIKENYSKVIGPLLKIVSFQNKKEYTPESAYKEVMQRMENSYLPKQAKK